MDPFEHFPAEVVEMILSHLRGRDLINCLFVSPHWNFFIESSSIFVDKFTMVLTSDCLVEDCQEILLKKKKWKSIKICDVNFSATSDVLKLLENVKSTMEHLELVDVYVLRGEDLGSCFNFKHLKSLTFWFCDEQLCLDLIEQNNSSLESLDLGYSGCPLTCVIDSLKQLRSLKTLKLSSDLFYCFLSKNFDDFPFHLDEFSLLKINLDIRSYGSQGDKLIKFLRTQANSIEKLHIEANFGTVVKKFALEMKGLKELRMMRRYWTKTDPPTGTLARLNLK